MIGGKHEAAFVAALEHALPAVHFPRFFSGKFLGSCIGMRLRRLQRRKRGPEKSRVDISKRAEAAEAAPKQQREMDDKERMHQGRVRAFRDGGMEAGVSVGI